MTPRGLEWTDPAVRWPALARTWGFLLQKDVCVSQTSTYGNTLFCRNGCSEKFYYREVWAMPKISQNPAARDQGTVPVVERGAGGVFLQTPQLTVQSTGGDLTGRGDAAGTRQPVLSHPEAPGCAGVSERLMSTVDRPGGPAAPTTLRAHF